MLLRSSSTPVLGSLLPSNSDTPNCESYIPNKRPPTHPNHNKLKSFNQPGSVNFNPFSCNSSPISPSVTEFSSVGRCSQNGFRRAQSEGNLEELANDSIVNDDLSFSNPIKKFSRKPSYSSMLQTIPSFSFHNSGKYEDEDSDEEAWYEREELEENGGLFDNALKGKESFKTKEVSDKLSIKIKKEMGLSEEIRCQNGYGYVGIEEERNVNKPMYLAKGFGITGVDIGFGNGGGPNIGGGGGGKFSRDEDGNSLEKHYKRMVEENPNNPLFLRNYAQFLHESKRDLEGAEEYYSRAILADPNDGEILSQYAKLAWELHRDEDRAQGYFERAIQAASEDSHIHAAYASFLWEIEEEDEAQEETTNSTRVEPPFIHKGVMYTSATA